MNSCCKVSNHAIEKHLYSESMGASVFSNRRVMFDSIKKCLDKPDKKNVRGKRLELIKTFTFDIGILGYSRRTSNTIKVVCTQTRRKTLVITAYPIVTFIERV